MRLGEYSPVARALPSKGATRSRLDWVISGNNNVNDRSEKANHMLTQVAQRAGLLVSIITCALVVYAHSKCLLTRHLNQAFNSGLSLACGAESAWPHLREDIGYDR